MYILERNEVRKGKNYEYTFYSPQLPQLIGYTNYKNTVDKYQWKIVSQDIWEWNQCNRNYVVLDYIPIVNTIKSFVLQLKYDISKNGEFIGKAFLNGICSIDYMVIGGEKFYFRRGNTNVIRPMKQYKWTIENERKKLLLR